MDMASPSGSRRRGLANLLRQQGRNGGGRHDEASARTAIRRRQRRGSGERHRDRGRADRAARRQEELESFVEKRSADGPELAAVAYRELDSDEYTVLWPEDYDGEFVAD